jgi:hypothetical protein
MCPQTTLHMCPHTNLYVSSSVLQSVFLSFFNARARSHRERERERERERFHKSLRQLAILWGVYILVHTCLRTSTLQGCISTTISNVHCLQIKTTGANLCRQKKKTCVGDSWETLSEGHGSFELLNRGGSERAGTQLYHLERLCRLPRP